MTKADWRQLAQLCGVMLKVGCVGFGGGSALIPILQSDLVDQYHMVSEEEFNKDVVVASITPGALPVEIACGVGKKVAGLPGMLLSAVCIALPGVMMTVLLSSMLAQFGTVITRQVNYLAVGVSAYIIYMLFCYAQETVRQARIQGKLIPCIITISMAFMFTAGKSIQKILDLEHSPIFAVSTVNVMVVTLFLVLYLRGIYHKHNTIPALVISIAYFLSVGKAQIIDSPLFTWVLRAVMAALIIRGLRAEARESHCILQVDLRPALRECGAWLLFLAALSIPSMLTFSDRWGYLADGVISTVISFGGGDAYLAVAGGLFVGTGFIHYTDFYSNVVPAANAFPGSILCKVLACTGYLAAYRATGSLLVGYGVALCGFGCSVAISGCTFSIVHGLYARMEQMPVFSLLTEVVRPVISGLMLSVALSIYYTCINTGSQARWPDLCAPVLCVALAVGCLFFVKKWGQRPLRMVCLNALLALICCNLFSIF